MVTHTIPVLFPEDCEETFPLNVEADFYKTENISSSSVRKNKTVLYFHGGGLLCGSRKDLPSLYRDMFLKEGYDFLAFDYPLAPEHSVSQIVDSCLTCVKWFSEHYEDILGLESPDYILFGRSSGAYLAVQTAYRTAAGQMAGSKSMASPSALLLFYGYHSLKEQEFSKESLYYKTTYPPVSEEEAFQSVKNSPDFDSLKSPRVLMYLYARQTGAWTELLGKEKEVLGCSLSDEHLTELPPAFLTASSTDNDVPFRISKSMSRKIPGSKFYPVYNLEHEFDQNTFIPEGRKAYEECLNWMEGI